MKILKEVCVHILHNFDKYQKANQIKVLLNRSHLLQIISILFVFNSTISCKKLIDIPPPVTNVTSDNVYASDATAISAVTGIYVSLSSGSGFFATGSGSISVLAGLSSDELSLWNGIPSSDVLSDYFLNSLHATGNAAGSQIWSSIYGYIYLCNSVLEGLENSKGLTPSVKQQLLGEAKFLRALFYFYLTNLYGDVPLVVTTDYKINSQISRSSKIAVYNQIIVDLKDAQMFLSDVFLKADLINKSNERVRPTRWAATALLARAYLFMGDWANAEAQSSSVIDNSVLFKLTTLSDVFKSNSNEAVWQLQPVNAGWNTEDAKIFILPVTGPNSLNPVYLSKNLLNSFDSNDKRNLEWINYLVIGNDTFYYPYKYKTLNASPQVSEYLMVLRLSELFYALLIKFQQFISGT